MPSRRIETIIASGELDERLDSIARAVRSRQDFLAEGVRDSLSPGDIVVFNSRGRPAYLTGLTAEVVRCNRTRIVLKTPHSFSYRRFSNQAAMTSPLGLVDKATDEQAKLHRSRYGG